MRCIVEGSRPGEHCLSSTADKKNWVGQSLPRKEENRLLRGRGKFADDIKLREMLYLRFVRSPYAHATIVSVDTSAAEALPGVVCTLTGAEIAQQTQPFIEIGPDPFAKIKDYPLAVSKVRYQGEPVAAVVAESPALADDAAELVQVEYEALDPVMDAEKALEDKSLLHEEAGTNRVWNGVFEYGDVESAFKDAAYVVNIDRLHFHRFSSTPLENNVVIAQWNPKDERIYYWCNNSFPSFAIQFLAAHLGVHIDRIRVETSDIGGSFGIKITSYPQMAVCALASKKAGGRPVKWVETRSEHMTSSAHGNERTFRDTRVALDKNGVITAIDSRHIDDCGAYPRYEPLGCVIWSQVFPGVYRFKNARIDFTQAVTNKCPVGPNRGYSRMQHLWFLERVVDICAHKLGIAADEMRLRNYIRTEEFPYTTPNGCVYDSGNYPKMLQVAKDLIGWDEWKKKQASARKEGRLIGIGIGTTLDSGTNNFGQSQIVNPCALFRQFAGRQLQAGYLRRSCGCSRLVPARPGTRNHRGAGRGRRAEYSSGPDHGAHRLRYRAQCAHRILRDLRQPVCGLRAVRGPRCGAETEGRNEAAGGLRAEHHRRRSRIRRLAHRARKSARRAASRSTIGGSPTSST